jgi:DNA-directed RNA polymerase subunit RPC12/RpoP
MAEFEEIAHAGGKVEFVNESGQLSTSFTHSKPLPVAVFQICVSYQGRLLDVVPIGAINVVYPQPSILVLIISDTREMFGRTCFECKSYFRANYCGKVMHCPYCGYTGNNVTFTTANQMQYIAAFCRAFMQAATGQHSVVIDLDSLINELPDNKTPWTYSEQEQQNYFRCAKCSTRYDILGEYGACPGCGKRNAEEVINGKLAKLRKEIEQAKEDSGRSDPEMDWEKLIRSVSEFEAMANNLRIDLLRLPATRKRKADLRHLNFENIVKASEYINQWFGFDILKDIDSESRTFLNIMFSRRHVFAHNAGRIDQKYLHETGETSVKMNQLIRLKKSELGRLLPLIKQVATNLINGVESIS